MHLTPGMRRVMDETQVKLVCASGVFELLVVVGFASLLEERDFAIDTDSSDQRRYKAGHEVLR